MCNHGQRQYVSSVLNSQGDHTSGLTARRQGETAVVSSSY